MLNKTISLSLSERQVKEMDQVVKELGEKYQSRNHFIRCAIIRLLKEE